LQPDSVLYVKESVPIKSAIGVYKRVVSDDTATVPWDGAVLRTKFDVLTMIVIILSVNPVFKEDTMQVSGGDWAEGVDFVLLYDTTTTEVTTAIMINTSSIDIRNII
tara:strand:- start:92 stop:412 length:321 start_codon:yes stop_codon:yes gene_type:complete